MDMVASAVRTPTRTPAPLRIATLARGDAATAARWDAFVVGCADATFFHRAGWLEVIGRRVRPRRAFPVRRARRRDRRRAAAGAQSQPPLRRCAGVAAVRRVRRRRGERRRRCRRTRGRGRAPGAGARRGASRTAQREGAPSRMADAGSLLHVPQGAVRRRRGQHARDSAQAARDGAQGHPQRSRQRHRCRRRPFLRAVRGQRPSPRHAGAAAALLRHVAARVRRGLRDPHGDGAGRHAAVQRSCRSTSATRCCRTTPATRSPRAISPPTTSSTGS